MAYSLYPLKFEPIYQYRLWGGRKLEHLLSKPLPKEEPIGEAWIISDRKDLASKVMDGDLKGKTITGLMTEFPEAIMGTAKHFDRFPLLLKFLDCNDLLSVQVHPSDHQKNYIPTGDTGKTEAWVILETDAKSRIYAGLTPGTTKENLLKSIENKSVADRLHSFVPKVGDAVFIHSGTVHTLGGTVVFEVQENSDVTFRLSDWDRIDQKTGKPREFEVDKALACIDFNQVNIGPVAPVKSTTIKNAEKLFDNDHFKLWRIISETEIKVGFKDEPTILVCLEGSGTMTYQSEEYIISQGEVMLLPAVVGELDLKPNKRMNVLQIAMSHINDTTTS